MKRILFFVVLGVFLSVISMKNSYAATGGGVSQAAGDSAKIKSIEAKLDKALSEIQSIKQNSGESDNGYLSGIKLSGSLVASYTYNFAKPEGLNGLGNLNYGDNWQSDGFAVNTAELVMQHSPGSEGDPYGVGFNITAEFGQNIQFFKAYYGDPSYFSTAFQDRTPYDIMSAYIDINLPVGSGLDIHVGKEPELLGFEGFNPIDNWNDTYSLLTFVEPATMTGIFMTYNFIPQLTSTLGIANTINSAVPVDNIPVIELNESYAATNALTVNGGFIYGPNSFIVSNGSVYQDNVNKSFYGYVNAQLSPTPDWSFVVDYEVGLGAGINNSVFTDNGLSSAGFIRTSDDTFNKSRFDGIVGYIHHQHDYGFGLVSETFRQSLAYDQNGLWEGASIPGTGNNYTGSTLTLGYQPSFKGFKNVGFRLEFERQGSNHPVYLDSNGNQTHSMQNTVNFMVLYSF